MRTMRIVGEAGPNPNSPTPAPVMRRGKVIGCKAPWWVRVVSRGRGSAPREPVAGGLFETPVQPGVDRSSVAGEELRRSGRRRDPDDAGGGRIGLVGEVAALDEPRQVGDDVAARLQAPDHVTVGPQ